MSSERDNFVTDVFSNETLKRIMDCFLIAGKPQSFEIIKRGYINRTYKVETVLKSGRTHKYILQRINDNVFPDVESLMHNFLLVTEHLRDSFVLPGRKEGRKSILSLCLTKENKAFLRDETGCWRVTHYFDNVYSMDVPDRLSTFRYAGEAFGLFAKMTSDMDTEDIKTIIPNFHNTEVRYNQLQESIKKDPLGRVKKVEKELASIESRKEYYSLISSALESGEIPTRVCHNDCNLNNILFDNDKHIPVAIIDLDTVMPSSPLYDYGDSMRVGTNRAGDNEKDLSKVSCDLAFYEQYARGFLSSCGSILTKKELELLPYAALIITSEDSIRFLKDYIDGDTYYQISYAEQNLDRAKTQIKLAEDMQKKLPETKRILDTIYSDLKINI